MGSDRVHAFGELLRFAVWMPSANRHFSPAAQLAAYEFVATWASLLPHFSFEAAYKDEPKRDEAFTMSVAGQLPVKISARDAAVFN